MFSLVLPLVLIVAGASGIRVEGPPDRVPFFERRVPVLLSQVESALGFRYRGQVLVHLARTDEEFRREVGNRPDWVVAVARPGRSALWVRLPAVGPGRGLDISSVLRHELVHVVLPQRLGGARVPLWFEEGLAQVLGGRVNRSDLDRLPVAAASDRLIPLAEISRSFPRDGDGAALAYAQGESVVTYLMTDPTGPGLVALLDDVRDTGSFEAGLELWGGKTPAELEEEWRDWLESSEPWWVPLLLSAFIPLLFFAVSVLAAVGYFVIRRRRRRDYEALPE